MSACEMRPRAEGPRVSALILARDEAANLPACLASLSWTDERVVVVYRASTDATEAVALDLADRVIVRRFDDFAAQRNAALLVASGDWVFAVDADERSSPEQADEVRSAIAGASHAGYRVPISSVVLGRPFRFSGTQDDRPLRLFRRDLGRWAGEVHETVDLDGSAGDLRHPLSHRTLPDMKTFLAKIDRYTTLEARRLADEGRPARASGLTIRPAWTFARLYLGKQGFRDGPEGLMFCVLSATSAAVRAWKHREILRGGGSS